ncbi:hypothetical protein [Flavobacterium granuli]|uniref:6-bladed beta-propeller protein n=1 Tax=Flavobacterium granuli TaxID=280093 RepID=A0ABU1S0R1_9FLAO|nr:hypothetical protein [Flavobacterium granuli]MDR6844586.1 hypothetical protein [Flavobacterium granuli]
MKFLIKFLAVICLTLSFSCSNETPSAVADTDQIKDDFNYLIVNSWGEINKIGNNTGQITSYSQFDGLTSGTVNLCAVTSNTDKIFLIEYYSGLTKLFIFDKKTKTTSSRTLVFPNEIVGSEPAISSLTWDDSKKVLYGIIVSNINITPVNNTSYLVKINPNTFDINYSGVSFDQTASISTFLNGNMLYSSLPGQDTYEIDTENNTAKKTLFNNSKFSFIKAAVYLNNTAYCITYKINGYDKTIAKINLTNNTYEDLLPAETLVNSDPLGLGYIDKSNNEYIFSTVKEANIEHPIYAILKFNVTTNTYKFLELKSDSSINSNFIIVDKIN